MILVLAQPPWPTNQECAAQPTNYQRGVVNQQCQQDKWYSVNTISSWFATLSCVITRCPEIIRNKYFMCPTNLWFAISLVVTWLQHNWDLPTTAAAVDLQMWIARTRRTCSQTGTGLPIWKGQSGGSGWRWNIQQHPSGRDHQKVGVYQANNWL